MNYLGFDKFFESEFLNINLYPNYPVVKQGFSALFIPESESEFINGGWLSEEDWNKYIIPMKEIAESNLLFCCEVDFYYFDDEKNFNEDSLVDKLIIDWRYFKDYQKNDTALYCLDKSFRWGILRPAENYFIIFGEDCLISKLLKSLGGLKYIEEIFSEFWGCEEKLRKDFVFYKNTIFTRLRLLEESMVSD